MRSRVAVASYVSISVEELGRLGLSSTFVEEGELAAARARYQARVEAGMESMDAQAKASHETPAKASFAVSEEDFAAFMAWKAKASHEGAVAAVVSDAVMFHELDPLLEAVRGDEAPQPTQDAQGQAPGTAEAAVDPEPVADAKPGRRAR
jgi:hypothetical protein